MAFREVIISVLLSVFLSTFVNRFFIGLDTYRKQRNVSRVLYSDIKRIQDIIKPVIEYYEKTYVTVAAANTLHYVINEYKVKWDKFAPLYRDDSPYYRLSKEIYLLDENTIKSISNFYNRILEADKEFITYMDIWDSYTNSKEYMLALNIQDNIVNNLICADKEASYLADRLILI